MRQPISKNNNNAQFKHFLLLSLIMCFLAVISSLPAKAANNFQLSQTAFVTLKANKSTKETLNWLPPVANPKNNKQFYFASTSGQFHILDDNILERKAFLDIFQQLGLNTEQSSEKNEASSDEQNVAANTRLTSFVLHPNFAKANSQGTNTLYTAHIEKHRQTASNRLTDGDDAIEFNFDAVISEWVLSDDNEQDVKHTEIVRIALPSMESGISQLTFNPYVTKFQAEFGQLYAVLPAQTPYQALPLYSGAVLRIHPVKSGLFDYTVPSDNPFSKNININDELLLIGAQNIKHINWYQNNSKQMVVSHNYNDIQQISLAAHIHDWRTTAPKDVLFSGDENASPATHFYRGKLLPALKEQLLLLKKRNKEWEIHSTHALNLKQSELSKTASKFEWAINAYQIATANHIGFFEDHNRELLVLDYSDKVIFKIIDAGQAPSKQSKSKATTSSNSTVPITQAIGSQAKSPATAIAEAPAASKPSFQISDYVDPSKLKRYGLITAAVVVVFVLIYLLRHKLLFLWRRITRKKFVRFERDESTKTIKLYKHARVKPSLIIEMADIDSLALQLNKLTMLNLTAKTEQYFSNETENLVRNDFKDEYQNKMFEKDVRTITLLLITKTGKHILLEPYLRKGNHRMTSIRYFDVIEHVIDLCWDVHFLLYPDSEEKRIIIPKEEKKPLYTMNTQPLSARAKSTPAVKPSATKDEQGETKTVQKTKQAQQDLAQDQQLETADKTNATNASTQATNTTEAETSDQETHPEHPHHFEEEFVDALEKLVKLRQAGLLTEEEFSQAKHKLLE